MPTPKNPGYATGEEHDKAAPEQLFVSQWEVILIGKNISPSKLKICIQG